MEGDTNEMSQLLRVQTEIEKELAERPTNLDRVECTPPGLCAEFQTARLFLSHFGFINKLVSILKHLFFFFLYFVYNIIY